MRHQTALPIMVRYVLAQKLRLQLGPPSVDGFTFKGFMRAALFLSNKRNTESGGLTSIWMFDWISLKINQAVALLLLGLFLPVMLLIAFAIWRTDGGQILFGHFRVGKDGKLFRCLKFRSMRVDSGAVLSNLLSSNPEANDEWVKNQKLRYDPRITPIGRFIRKTSLDELPQLVNVLRGEMRMVGPRPITVAELTRYGTVRWHYLSVHPGITGLWQVSGRNNTTYDERVALDRLYVEHRTFVSDVVILLRTIQVVLLREGAS